MRLTWEQSVQKVLLEHKKKKVHTGKESTAEDGTAVEQALAHIALSGRVVRCLLVRTAEGVAELCDIVRGADRWRFRCEEVRALVVERARSDCLRRLGRSLLERRGDGEGAPQEERHCVLL
jgi:hypothetical protein